MPDERDDLADVPPEEFVAARDAVAKRLKSEGKSDEAAAVKRLRRPTVTRWVADQVLRHHAREVDAFRSAVRRVAAAQEAAVTGGDRASLADATAERRVAVTALGGAVDDVLARDDRPRHHHDEALGAIEADVTAEVASGGTFGIRDDLELPERPATPGKKPAKDRVAERREAQARAALDAAEARVARAREELANAEATLSELQERHRT
jgi:hypothetical protein